MSRPNIVFILADDLGYGDFSALNGGLSSTPTLDALIREGVCLTQHYTASPVCNPSRACLLTGRYPHRTGSVDTLEWWGLERLALRERTLADMLKAAGYATGLVGKWHLGAFDERYHPQRRGFDETVCFRGGMHDYWQWRIEWGGQARRSDGRYLTDLWAEEASAFIERHRREPFFLHLTFNAPHTPLQVPDEEVKPFLGKAGVPTGGVARLYGMIHRMDSAVARVLETLRRCGLEENTLVLFCSDNGPQFGGRGDERLDRFNSNLNGCKGNVYEGGIRVPMILRWPAGLPGRREVGGMVHFADWLPTLLAATGTPLPPDNLPLDGVNVLPVLRGEDGKTQTRRCWQWNRYAPLPECNAAVRDGDWKLVRPWRDGAGEVPDIQWLAVSMYGPEHFIHNGIFRPPYPVVEIGAPRAPLLFNLRADPGERENLAEAHPAQVSRLSLILENWFAEVEAEWRSLPENRGQAPSHTPLS
ncbi:MAG: Arylsulfatase precursor [Lentisphaerae bacterium ADurb.BinA184]|nr:MAG: Arylsulfatase precursor [Lentisphaerae bacterium ADurb.BinA184]